MAKLNEDAMDMKGALAYWQDAADCHLAGDSKT